MLQSRMVEHYFYQMTDLLDCELVSYEIQYPNLLKVSIIILDPVFCLVTVPSLLCLIALSCPQVAL